MGVPVRTYANSYEFRRDIAADLEAAVFTTGTLHRLAVWCRSSNTILGIGNHGDLTQIYNTNIQDNLDYLPASAESPYRVTAAALCSVLVISFNIY